jgi:hypothetical protein
VARSRLGPLGWGQRAARLETNIFVCADFLQSAGHLSTRFLTPARWLLII